MYQNVIVPTDGSATAERAVDHALELAARFQAKLHALYVVDEGLFSNPITAGSIDEGRMLDEIEATGVEITEQIADAAHARDIDAKGVVLREKGVVPAILAYAEEVQADVIVMGTHGRSGVGRFLMGSVAEKVLRQSDVPVVLVPPGQPD